jgi:hypothetical protein
MNDNKIKRNLDKLCRELNERYTDHVIQFEEEEDVIRILVDWELAGLSIDKEVISNDLMYDEVRNSLYKDIDEYLKRNDTQEALSSIEETCNVMGMEWGWGWITIDRNENGAIIDLTKLPDNIKKLRIYLT